MYRKKTLWRNMYEHPWATFYAVVVTICVINWFLNNWHDVDAVRWSTCELPSGAIVTCRLTNL